MVSVFFFSFLIGFSFHILSLISTLSPHDLFNEGGIRPMLFHVLNLLLQGFVRLKNLFLFFLVFFGLTCTEMGVVIFMYLKHSPDYIDTKYIQVYGFMGLTS